MSKCESGIDVLLVHRAFATPSDPGGTRHFTLGRELVRRGHRFRVIGSRLSYLTGDVPAEDHAREPSEEVIEGVEIRRVPAQEGIGRGPWQRARRLVSFSKNAFGEALGHAKPDVVMGTTPGLDQALAALVLSKIWRVPFVLEVRDLWPDFLVDMGVVSNPLLVGGMRFVERLLYRSADRLIVNSPAYVDHVAESGVDPSVVDFVPNGVDIRMFDGVEAQVPGGDETGRGRREGRFSVLYLGNHGPSNALGTLLDAAERLRDEDAIEFVLIGGGSDKERLVREAEDRGLANVSFEPACPKREVPERLSGADACVATLMDIPMFRLTYPNKVFDYMAAGRPTVLAIEGVIRDVIEAADGGIPVPPEDPEELAEAVLELYENPDLARRFGKSARDYVEKHFDWSRIAPDLEASLLQAARG